MVQKHKKPALRLYHGVSGSALAQVDDVPTRAALSGAERQRRYDAKKRLERLTNRLRLTLRKLYPLMSASNRDEMVADLVQENSSVEMMEAVLKIYEETKIEKRIYLSDLGDPDGTPSVEPVKANHELTVHSGSYDLAKIVGAREAVESNLGSPFADDDDGDGPIGGRREVRPQGNSGRTEPTSNTHRRFALRPTWDKKTFKVKLAGPELTNALNKLQLEHFKTIPETKNIVDPTSGDLIQEGRKECYQCQLCGYECDWPNDRPKHIESVHGDPDEPSHDKKHGNVVARHIKEARQLGHRLKKAGSVALRNLEELQQYKDRRAAEAEAKRNGFIKRDGEWVKL
jgi:hypothetical protein